MTAGNSGCEVVQRVTAQRHQVIAPVIETTAPRERRVLVRAPATLTVAGGEARADLDADS